MNKTLRWVLYILLGLVGLLVVIWILFSIIGGYGYGMMGPGFPWMDHMRFGFSPARMIFGWLLGLGVFLLVVVGLVALVAALVRGSQSTPLSPTNPAVSTCPNCGRVSQEDWKTCPYCGNPLV